MRRFAAFAVGAVFGLTLSWSGMTDPDVLRDGLLFRDAYLMLFFASALATAFVGLRVLKVLQPRAVLTGEPVELDDGPPGAPARRRQRAVRHRLGARRRVPGPDRRAARAGRAVGARDDRRRLRSAIWLYLRRSAAVAPERRPRALGHRPERTPVAAEG